MHSMTIPAVLLRLEGAVVFGGSVFIYARLGGSGWWFVLLFLVFDLSAIGYLVNPRWGSFTYNTAHTYVLPALLLFASHTANWNPGILLALIWFGHIGIDRTLGFGLKYTGAFKDTHLNRV